MSKKYYFFIILIIIAAGIAAYFYFAKFYSPQDQIKVYTAEDFPNALERMSEDILEKTLADLNNQYQKKEEGDHIYIRWINIGILKKRLGDYVGTEEAWQNAISYNPDQALAFGNLADLYLFDLGENEKAEEYYKKVLTMNPNHFNYYHGLAALYRYNTTEKAGLIEDLMLDGAKINPGEAESYYMYLANYFNDTKTNNGGEDKEKAKLYTQKTLAINPDLKDQLPDL